jgi:hypothetical protein
MTAAELVVVCALELLGRSASQLPRIEILDERPRDATPTAVAFADIAEGVIYLIASAPPFSIARAAQTTWRECREPDLLRLVASTIVHEEWHIRHGPDERGAYLAQLMALQQMGLGPESNEYRGIKRAMHVVLAARQRSGGPLDPFPTAR